MSSNDLHPENPEPPDNSMLAALTELSKPTDQSLKRARVDTDSEESESDERTSGDSDNDSDSSKSPRAPPPLRRANGGSLIVAKKMKK
jgi:hypothetical protein